MTFGEYGGASGAPRGAERQRPPPAGPFLPRNDVGEPVAGGRRRGVEQALDVDLAPARERELEVVGEAPVAGDVRERLPDPREDHQVVAAVEDRRNAALPDLEEPGRAAPRHPQPP